MKRKPEQNGIALDRRSFLTGTGVTLGALQLQSVTSGATSGNVTRHLPPQRAVHQGLAYFDHDGVGEAWDKPSGNRATRDYVNSISQETFLRRHWFT